MTALAKNVQTHTSPPLQETFNVSYSHGLEAIYSIETIDLKSIRKLNIFEPKKSDEKKNIPAREVFFESQLCFDFGPAFREWIPSLVPEEPIQVLDLSKPVEKILLEKGLCKLESLSQANLQDLSFLRGVGQGHIEEIKNKLNQYLIDKPKGNTLYLDPLSLLKCFSAHIDRKKLYIAFEPYGLHSWITLSPMEKAELKRLNPESRCQWVQEVWLSDLQKRTQFLEHQIELWVETWIRPWIFRRGGFAKKEEVFEWLFLHSLDEKIAEKVFSLLDSKISFDRYLPLYQGIFSASSDYQEKLQLILSKAISYFKKVKSWYYLEELSYYLQAEFALQWKSIDTKEIHLALSLSDIFQLIRGEEGKWVVSLGKMRYFLNNKPHNCHKETPLAESNSSMYS